VSSAGQAAAQPVRLVLSLAAITAGCWLLGLRTLRAAALVCWPVAR